MLSQLGSAWLILVFALALHVAEEAATGFLPFYNSSILILRQRLGFFPVPTFSFGLWLGGLISALVLLFLLTPVVIRGGRITQLLCKGFGVLMVLNGLGHIIGSVYFATSLPGVWSSPILLIAAAYLVYRVAAPQPEPRH